MIYIESTTVHALPRKIKDTVMRADAQSTLDIFVEKGRKEGLQEGHLKGRQEEREKAVRNMILKGSTTEFICDVLEVTSDYIARIRREMKAGK